MSAGVVALWWGKERWWLFVGCLTSQQHASSVSHGRVCSDSCTCCHTERYTLRIKLFISSSHSILKPGQPVPELILLRQAPGRVATGIPMFEATGVTRPGKISTAIAGIEPRSAALGADTFTTWPTRRCKERFVCLLVGCLTSQQHASVSQGRSK